MVWITEEQVGTLLRRDLSDDEFVDELIDHCQGLAEIEIGAQTDPSVGLQSVLAQIVARFWQAGESARINPAALQAETTGPFTIQDRLGGVIGLGLTNREIALLKKAVGRGGLWVQPISLGDTLETPGRESSGFPDRGDARPPLESLVEVDDGEGEPVPWVDLGA